MTFLPVAMAALGLLASLSLSGCAAEAGGCLNSESTGVSSGPGSFSLGKNVSSTCSDSETYSWQNSSTRAQVSYGGNLAQGSMDVSINDAKGTQVFSKTFSGTTSSGGATTTASGSAGTWSVTVNVKGVTGQLGLSINSA